MRKQYEQRLADEAAAWTVSSTPADCGPREDLPTPPKSPAPLTTSDEFKSSTDTSIPHLPPEIPPPSLAPSPRASLPLVSVKEPSATAELSDLSEPDEVDELEEPHPPKAKSKRGRARKTVVESPLPAPKKKARLSRKRK
jgi:hypothetical protein